MYESDKRPTIYHPETAYWVNLDVNVPLFLVIKRRCCSGLSQVSQPTYADTRISDIRAVSIVARVLLAERRFFLDSRA